MSWYGIDAVDKAVTRMRMALFEPFDFWKWVKLAVIIFLLGGITSAYGGSGNNYHMNSKELKNNFPEIGVIQGYIPHNISIENIPSSNIPFVNYGLLIAVIAALVILILLLYYISNIMEFVFVESMVRNEVKFWAYSKRFLGKGFYLLLIRFALGLAFLALLIIAILPFVLNIIKSPSEPAWPILLSGILWILGVIVVLILLGLIINSLLSLAIPVSIYREIGILSAFRLIFANFRKSWLQVLVYWFIRVLLGIGVAILMIILFVVISLVLGIVFLAVDGIMYFIFSSIVSDTLNWVLMIPFILIELLLLFGTLLLLNVPFAVFLKYHLLSFLETWFAGADIPFFDASVPKPEIGLTGSELNA
jgi:hypothetical protein